MKFLQIPLSILLFGSIALSKGYAAGPTSIFTFHTGLGDKVVISYSLKGFDDIHKITVKPAINIPASIPAANQNIYLTLAAADSPSLSCQYMLPPGGNSNVNPLSGKSDCPILILAVDHQQGGYTNNGLTFSRDLGLEKNPGQVSDKDVTLKVCNTSQNKTPSNDIVWMEAAQVVPGPNTPGIKSGSVIIPGSCEYIKMSQYQKEIVPFSNRITLLWKDSQDDIHSGVPGTGLTKT